MAHSLETSLPFMDNDLVEFAMQCPVNTKLKNLGSLSKMDENTVGPKPTMYFQKTNDGKQLLREMMRRYLKRYS